MTLPMENVQTALEDDSAVRMVIKMLAERCELSIKRLAELSGLTYATLYDHLTGRAGHLTMTEVIKVAPHINTTASEIVRMAETGTISLWAQTGEWEPTLLRGGGDEDELTLPLFRPTLVN